MGEKSDMERIGLFKEMPYVTINDPYMTPLTTSMDRGMVKGRQIIGEGPKLKSAHDDGYFLKPFTRIFEGEGESNIMKIRRKWRADNIKGMLGKAFIPSFYGIGPSGVGSRIGCMQTDMPYFSGVTRDIKAREEPKKNFYTNPGKKGSGYGYLDVCLNPYPSAVLNNPYDRARDIYFRKDREEHLEKSLNRKEFVPSKGYGDYFWPNPYIDLQVQKYKARKASEPGFTQSRAFIPSAYPKKAGGCKCGTLTPYPPSVKAEYRDMELRHIVHDIRNNGGKIYVPPPGSKSCIYQSVLQKNVNFRVNNLNSSVITKVMNY